MTLPTERCMAVLDAKHLLWEIGFELKRIPKPVRDRAKAILRHYPWDTDVLQLSEACPEVLQIPPPEEE